VRLGTRLILGIIAAALLPLLLLGVAANQVASRAVIAQAGELHVQKASNLATFVDTYLAAQIRGFNLILQTFPLADLDERQLIGFERLVYRQFDDVGIVALVDRNGMDVVPSQYEVEGRAGGATALAREPIGEARYLEFRRRLPFRDVQGRGLLIGEPYLPGGARAPVVAMALECPDAPRFILGVELSLSTIVALIERQAEPGMEMALLDAQGAFIARQGADLVRTDPFRLFVGGTPNAELRYTLADGTRVLAAFERVESLGWLAVVAEPFDAVEVAGRQIRLRSGYFGVVAALLAAAMGLVFTRSIQRPVVQLRDAAVAVGRGELGRVVVPDEVKELGDLGRAFNEMSQHIKENHDEIEAQREAIASFNVDLQRRVDERTRELTEAQEKLVESGKLAAVAEMGAGLAHELNNPLAGILGLTQLLKARNRSASEQGFLESLEAQALRCTEIVRTLLSFTRPGLARHEFCDVELDALLVEVLEIVGGAARMRGVRIEHERASSPLGVHADRTTLARALAQLLMSVVSLIPEGGRLSVAGERREGEVRVVLECASGEGRGVGDRQGAATDDWFASGMSLWVARRILAEHGGRLTEPEAGAPGRYVLILPKA
jgi:signal transduction histidine kinase